MNVLLKQNTCLFLRHAYYSRTCAVHILVAQAALSVVIVSVNLWDLLKSGHKLDQEVHVR